MRQGKEISSVKNSIQTRLSGVMLLVLVFALGYYLSYEAFLYHILFLFHLINNL